MIGSQQILAALATSALVMLVSSRIVRIPRRLGSRVRPYAVGARTALGGSADVGHLHPGSGGSGMRDVLWPMLHAMASALDRLIGRSGGRRLGLLIRQAGLFPELEGAERISAYRLRQLGSVALWCGGSVLAAPALGLTGAQFAGLFVLLLIVGATRQRGALERAIEERRDRMTVEIYTIDQLLALRARAGGGVVSIVSAVCARGRGEVVGELDEALRLHRAGTSLGEAFGRIARLTPEPYCARTYSLLALADERGVDLADGLLALAEDVREARRESTRRAATRRRAAMLIPTIAILAPVMLLFVGAPLPRLLLGS